MRTKSCSVKKCSNKSWAKKLCITHLSRLRLFGSTLPEVPVRNKTARGGLSATPEYRAWRSMGHRCNNPRDASYSRYGGRGIKVCGRWKKFENFLEDMGARPRVGYSLERKNNSLGYSPSNCVWATAKEQMRNRGVSVSAKEILSFKRLRRAGYQYKQIAAKTGRGYTTVFNYINDRI